MNCNLAQKKGGDISSEISPTDKGWLATGLIGFANLCKYRLIR